MNFLEWLKGRVDEVATRPHMPFQYYQNKIERISALEQRLSGFVANFDNIVSALWDATGHDEFRNIYLPYDISSKIPNENSYYQDSFSGAIKSFMDYMSMKNAQGWERSLAMVNPFNHKDYGYKEFLQNHMDSYFKPAARILRELPQMVQDIKQYGESPQQIKTEIEMVQIFQQGVRDF